MNHAPETRKVPLTDFVCECRRRVKRVVSLLLVLMACRPATTPPTPVTPDPNVVDPETCDVVPAVGTPLRLLTRAEYDLTVRDLLGATGDPAADFPREPLSHGLDNDATLNRVTDAHVARYLDAAEALAHDAVTNRRDTLLPCSGDDEICGQQFVVQTGLRAFRRPLRSDERETLNALFASIHASDGFDAAMELTLQSVLQSPQFLYRDEAPFGTEATAQLNGFQLATRLSYFIWGSMPDAELLDAAATGALDTPEGLTAQAQRMLDDPKSVDGLMRFFSVWLYLDGVDTTEKTTSVYPQFTPALAHAWRSSLELFIEDVLSHEGTLPALLASPVVYTNDAMSMYGMNAPTSDFVRNELGSNSRQGLLTQPGFLAFKAMPDGSSPVRRGIFVLDKLMCQTPPPPPAAFTPPAVTTTQTTRQRFAAHSQNDGCKGCHQFIDPVGFTFEHFDGMGVWRDSENGFPIDSSGGVVAADDGNLIEPVADINGLSALLAKSPQVHACVSKEVYRFALGRPLTEQDACTLAKLGDRFFKSGGNFRALMLAIVQTEAFRSNLNPEAP